MPTTSKFQTVAILFGICMATVFATCKKSIDCSQTSYSFEIAARAFPDLDSILVGDTVWIEINEPVGLKDIVSGSPVNFDNAANLSTLITFLELKGNMQFGDAVNDFDYKLAAGTFTGNTNMPNRFREYIFLEENLRYVLKLGIIPKRTGIFRISLSDAANVYRRNDGCSKAFFRINFKNTNQHLYFNEWNFGVVVPLPNNGYCFKVE